VTFSLVSSKLASDHFKFSNNIFLSNRSSH